jgi:hypothetical protein
MTWSDGSAAGAAPEGAEPVSPALELPSDVEASEPPVFFLDGGVSGPAAPISSPMLAALYESQGDAVRATEVRRTLARGAVESRLAARLPGWLHGLRDVRRAWLARADGTLTAETRPGAAAGSLPAGWPALLEAVRELAEVLGWGEPLTLSVVRADGKVACGLLPARLALGIEGGAGALPGQLRARLRAAAAEGGGPEA